MRNATKAVDKLEVLQAATVNYVLRALLSFDHISVHVLCFCSYVCFVLQGHRPSQLDSYLKFVPSVSPTSNILLSNMSL